MNNRETKSAQIFRVGGTAAILDRKSTRLNSSHTVISYAVFCLKKKKNTSKLQSHSDLGCGPVFQNRRARYSAPRGRSRGRACSSRGVGIQWSHSPESSGVRCA